MEEFTDVWNETFDMDKTVVCHMQCYTGGEITQAHVHDFVELIYGVDCEYTMFVEDKEYYFTTGDFMMIRSNETHKIINLRNTSSKHICIRFNVYAFLKSCMMRGEKYIGLFMKYNDSIPRFYAGNVVLEYGLDKEMVKILGESIRLECGCELAIASSLLNILFILIRNATFSKDVENEFTNDKRIAIAIQYIDEHYQYPLTISQMAHMCYVSENYFSRWFKQMTKKTFVEYVNYIRIEHATVLLINSDYTVTQIATMVGFSSTSYFIQQFKKLKGGCSPKRYRIIYQRTYSIDE